MMMSCGEDSADTTWRFFKSLYIILRVSAKAEDTLGIETCGLFLPFFPSAVGEPPLCMSCASLFAVKHAVEAARDEIEKGDDYFAMSKS